MNAILATARPLPAALQQRPAPTVPSAQRRRRSHVGGFRLAALEVDRFNAFLISLGRSQAPYDRDQLATAARELCDCSTGLAPTIGFQMRRAAAAALMVDDPAWDTDNEARAVASRVVSYVRGHNDLIPDQLPRVGRLDDAIVIETAWPLLAAEVDEYLDYRRLRRIEARLRGCAPGGFGFTRAQWQHAFRAETALAAHQRSVREHSYLPASASRFQVH